ncbi:SF1B family DNA helicase RecD2 [Candidiatus Paracoxiella cheracis]|uniref:SF1B family DNA helicase RecD2 n=1 Tax=Candidiatus Paracoxiella cheracis TaxID=3405120 RepID=UPI003BF5E8BA
MPITTEQQLERIQGSVERVTFHSEETGFCVLRTKVKGRRDLVTIIGNAASITAGEFIECQGSWVNDKKHGLQFKTQQLRTVPPTTLEGIEKYLGSGMVKGIGPHFAKKLVTAFKEQVFDVIENEPDRLMELEGIGAKRKEQVTSAWAEQKVIRDIMVFLQSHGVGTARSVRIYKTYGDDAIEKVRENPYRLALDIRGIGFKTADNLASQLGIANDSLIRGQAGVRHVLQELCDNGHCAAEQQQLIKASVELLGIPVTIIEEAIQHEIQQENLVPDEINSERCVYPISLYTAETKVAENLKRLNTSTPPWGDLNIDKAIPWVEKKTGLQFAESQRHAIETVLRSKLAIITGGPGVGKTTIVNGFIKIIRAKGMSVGLCAPTGRAAKRLTETTGLAAKTIHRLLDFEPKTYSFKHNQDNPLPVDVLIIDESSMIDIVLFNHLLKAIPNHAALILVGDIDQLPSVGSGAVLSDLIKSSVMTTVRLTEIFRQAADSKIIVNAHRVNHGKMPLPNESENSDFFTLYAETQEEIHDTLIDVVARRLPQHYRCDPIRDIQVLAPMNRGGLGSRGLNVDLQRALNSNAEPKITRFGSSYATGDKVIQMTNNYDKEVFNGDIGFIERIDLEDSMVKIRFDQTVKDYNMNELDEINLAYAISIHKSQGSEFPIIVIPLATQHYTLLARNLLYTAITRGKQLVILIGQKKAIGMAVSNNKEANRLTKLADRLGVDY